MTHRTAADWNRVLISCNVKPTVAAVWSTVFADEIGDTTFNLGDAEIDDFLGQILHESAGLTRFSENLNYRAARIREIGNASKLGTRWRSLVPRADELAGNPQAFAEAVYGGRMGNTALGDGWNYRGRAPLQITGFDNYLWLGGLMGLDLVGHPEYLEDPHHALRACILWWENRIPDSMIGDVERETRRVNGGLIGLAQREELTELAHEAIQ